MKLARFFFGVAAASFLSVVIASGQAADTQTMTPAVGNSAGNSTTGAEIYTRRCAGCHGADGQAHTRAGTSFHALDFHDPAVMKMTDADLTSIIHDGKKNMPPFGTRLSQDDIENVVAYIHTLQKK